jgi:hypothetical protein
MKIKDVGLTALLGIAGALIIAAAIFIFFAPPETVNVIAQHIGLQSAQMERKVSETAGSEPTSRASRKSRSKRVSRSSLPGGNEVPLQAATPTHVQSEIPQVASPDSKTAKSELTVSPGVAGFPWAAYLPDFCRGEASPYQGPYQGDVDGKGPSGGKIHVP